MKNLILSAILGASLMTGGAANATTVFSEDFSDEATANGSILNFTGFDQFSVADGTVDLISSGGFGITCETGGCVDLDGSNGNSGLFSAPLNFIGGVTYRMSAWLSGNQRTGAVESVEFGVTNGAESTSVTVFNLSGDTFGQYSFDFGFASDTMGTLFFQDQGNDNVGAVLDRVEVTADMAAVPLPATAVLLFGALGGLGVLRKRRKAA